MYTHTGQDKTRGSVGRELGWHSKGRRFDFHGGQAYFPGCLGVDQLRVNHNDRYLFRRHLKSGQLR